MSDKPIYSRFIPGNPVPQPRQRHRGYIKNNKAMVQNYTAKNHPVQSWKDIIITTFIQGGLKKKITGPVKLDTTFMIPRPKSHYRTGKFSHLLKDSSPKYWHIQKPDRDNLEKAVMDALTDLGVWEDDCQACCGQPVKIWDNDNKPGCHVVIREL
jgi:crossover junction endodeoxyribonuclease RusA